MRVPAQKVQRHAEKILSRRNATSTAQEPRETDQDHEWYPTTDEIRKAMRDLHMPPW